ncbi:sterol desaturase family protein [Roseobacter sp. HKCCD7870]|uniref:sterol desaturase family protein n=1 Tax=Roseobacter sp. HKCCD7870 TaxID=3120343 RepID=UPI0030EEFC1B
MDDLKYGTRDKRGSWRPNAPLIVGPLLDTPWSLVRVLKWIPSYLLPWNSLFFALATILWVWLTPSREALQSFELGWISFLLLRNAAMILVLFGILELGLYVKRRQGNHYKYNARFPADHPSDVFWFRSQSIDNALRTFLSGVPIWTAYEVILLWSWANNIGLWSAWSNNPIWLAAFALLLPLLHEAHFYCVHRLIHLPFLYKSVHSVHHNSINPSPWSSLSMHPFEHLLYWSGTLIHLIVPSHPLLVLYHLHISGTGAVIGHIGFDKIQISDNSAVDTHAYAHYLHHKYFEVNYADGALPLDKWMGTWHDGTLDADRLMKERLRKRNSTRNGVSP